LAERFTGGCQPGALNNAVESGSPCDYSRLLDQAPLDGSVPATVFAARPCGRSRPLKGSRSAIIREPDAGGGIGSGDPFSRGRAFRDTASQRQGSLEKEKDYIMKKPTIVITETDHIKLTDLIAGSGLSRRERAQVRALEEELRRAKIVAPNEVPADVVTMETCAELLDLDTGELMEFTVVLPNDANIDDGKISILAPVGTGMLGYRVGDIFEWPAPYGLRRLKVIHVHFQPEAALAANAA